MKVAIVAPSLSGGGAEFVALQWARHLAASGFEVTVVTTSKSKNDYSAEGFFVAEYQGSTRLLGMMGLTFYLNRLCRDRRVDSIISLMPYWNLSSLMAGILARLSGRTIRVVISEHNIHAILGKILGRSFIVQRWLAFVLYRFCSQAIAVSHPVAAELVSFYRLPAERVWVVPNPVLGSQEVRGARRSNIDASMPAEATSRLCVVFSARLVEQKRPLLAVDVVAKLRDLGWADAELLIFGDGPLLAKLRKRADVLGVNLRHESWTDDWTDHCPPNSVFLLTSISEGFGNVLVDAANAAIPSVVSSKCLGAADACLPGVTATLTTGDSIVDYANAVSKSLVLPHTDVKPWLERFTRESAGAIVISVLLEGCPK
ncbi:glycosyltransferase [Rhodococcoides fascians]|uniref:glycosyltransferase n=1 Tax=Rhodococcoides fascians TaxID=1828 RepID=UPI003CE6B6CE